MRKMLLVTLIGMVLAINLYGFVNDIVDYYKAKEVENNKGYTVVYVE